MPERSRVSGWRAYKSGRRPAAGPVSPPGSQKLLTMPGTDERLDEERLYENADAVYSVMTLRSDHDVSPPGDVDLLCAAVRRIAEERDQARRELRELQRQFANHQFLGKQKNEKTALDFYTSNMSSASRHRYVTFREKSLRLHQANFDEIRVITEFMATETVVQYLGVRARHPDPELQQVAAAQQ